MFVFSPFFLRPFPFIAKRHGTADRRTSRFRLDSSCIVRGNRKSFTGHDELFLSRRRKIAGNFPATRWAGSMWAIQASMCHAFCRREGVCVRVLYAWLETTGSLKAKEYEGPEWMRESRGSSGVVGEGESWQEREEGLNRREASQVRIYSTSN